MEFSTRQLEMFWEAFTTPGGGIFVLIFLAFFFLALLSKSIKWLLLPLPLWMCTFAYSSSLLRSGSATLAFPLEHLRPYGRPLTGGLLLLLLLPSLIAHRGWRRRLLLPGTIAMFVFEMLLSSRVALGGMATRGAAALLIYLIVFLILGVGLSSWLQEWSHVLVLIRCLAASAMLFVAGTIYQAIANPGAIVRQGRFYATTVNPQAAGLVLAMGLLPVCYLLVRGEGSKLWKLLLGATAGFLVIFLVWTGSRTGAIVAIVGVGLLFRARLARWLVAVLVVGVFVFLAWQIFGESSRGAEHLLSTTNTRRDIWAKLLTEFQDNAVVGVLHDEMDVGESSYFSTAARSGLLGLIPLTAAVVLIGLGLLKLQRIRKRLGEHMLTADLVTGALAALGVGAIFEGYLLGVLSQQILLIYIYLAILAFILDVASASAEAAEQPPLEVSELEPVY